MAAVSANNDQFDADDYIINIIKRAVAHVQDVAITLPGVGQLIALTTRGEYFAAPSILPAFCRAPADQLKVAVLEGPPAGMQAIVGRNLDELMWCAGFFASQGRLMEGCHHHDVVQLRHWPNLTRLPVTPNSMRMAALFARHPTSISLAYRLLKVEPAEMYQFYCAARCAGLAVAVNRKAEEPDLKPHRNQPLLGALLAKIAGL